MKIWRPDRCGVCGKRREHANHQLSNPRPPTLLGRLLRCFWPRWLWGEEQGVHIFQDDAQRAALSQQMYHVRERLRKKRVKP